MAKQRIDNAIVVRIIAIVLCMSAASISVSNASSLESVLTLRLVHPDNDELSKLPSSAINVDKGRYEHLVDQKGTGYWVDKKIELDSKHIKAVKIVLESGGPGSSEERAEIDVTPAFIARNPHLRNLPDYRVRLFLTENGAKKLQAVTKNNLKGRLAVIFDGRVLEAPFIWEEIDTDSIDMSYFTYEDARRVKDAIMARRL
jgi:hypothetical protein